MNGQLTKFCRSRVALDSGTLGQEVGPKNQRHVGSVLCFGFPPKSTLGPSAGACSLWRQEDEQGSKAFWGCPVFGANHLLLATRLSEKPRAVLDQKGYMGILSHTTRDRVEALSGRFQG